MTTPKLSLVEIAQAQADKYATHNEALRGIDALLPKVAIAVQHTPPGAPSNGDVYIISDGSPTATGAWAGQDGDVAWYNGSWNFVTPVKGWVVYVQGESAQWVFDGTNWSALAGDSGTLDGLDSTQFLRSDVADTADALISFAAGIGSAGSKVAETFTNGVYFGTGVSAANRGAISHNGTNVTIQNYLHGGTVNLNAEDNGGTNRTMLVADPDTSVDLYYAGAKVLESVSTGLFFGSSVSGGNRGQLTADATTVILRNRVSGGVVQVRANSTGAADRLVIAGNSDNSVDLYYAGTVRLATNATGITINSGPTWTSGTGSPESVVTAPVGSLFSRTDGGASTTLYVKESGSGNTGWQPK